MRHFSADVTPRSRLRMKAHPGSAHAGSTVRDGHDEPFPSQQFSFQKSGDQNHCDADRISEGERSRTVRLSRLVVHGTTEHTERKPASSSSSRSRSRDRAGFRGSPEFESRRCEISAYYESRGSARKDSFTVSGLVPNGTWSG
jgi:hypothetical protein